MIQLTVHLVEDASYHRIRIGVAHTFATAEAQAMLLLRTAISKPFRQESGIGQEHRGLTHRKVAGQGKRVAKVFTFDTVLRTDSPKANA